MNKNRYKVIFNQVRGQMMVIAETAKYHLTGTTETSGETFTRNFLASLRPIAFCLLIITGNLMLAGQATAGIVADPNAPANQRPIIGNAANGLPLVNIQTPSAAGVSRNTYKQFDVKAQGAILNNSRTNVQTQLGGWVQGNPHLAGGTARIILNEVNSQNPSLLNGYIEVAGSRAQIVIANPAGISCNGCGFINASRTTLTTGTPIMNNGDLMGYRVGGGVINFLGAGLDTANSNYTDVIARAVNINAGLWAQNLNIVTGSNRVNVASNGDIAGITPITPNAKLPDGSSNPTPGFAMDVAALGGMYAGKIHMIGTEAGLGVRNAGSTGASVGEVRIDANGMLTNTSTGRITSAGNTKVTTTNGINNQGAIYAQGSATLTTSVLDNQAGYIGAKGAVTANSTAISNNTGTITSEATITLSGNGLDNQAGRIEALGNISINTTNNIDNRTGLLRSGQTLTLAAADIDNRNTQNTDATGIPTQGVEAQSVSITADHIDNSTGAMRVDNSLAIIGIGTLNNSLGKLSSAGLLSIADRLANVNHNVAGKSLAITNTNGTIIAESDLNIDSHSLTGDGKVLSAGNLTTKLTSDHIHTGEWQANDNATFITTGTLTNQAKLLAGDTLNLIASTLDNQADGEIIATNLRLNATDTHTLTNRGLIDGSDTFIDTVTLNNIGTGRIYGDHVAIAATTLTNDEETVNGITKAAVIAARDRLDIGAQTITNQNDALIFSAGDMAIGGGLDESHHVFNMADSLLNESATIETLGNISISASSLTNKKQQFEMARIKTAENTRQYQECVAPDYCSYIWHITEKTTTYQDSVIADSPMAVIRAAGNGNLTADNILNQYSSIQVGGDLNLIGQSLVNQGAELYRQTDTLLTKVLIHWGDRYHGTWTDSSSSSTLLETVPAIINAVGNLTGSFTDRIDNVSIRQHTALSGSGSGTQVNVHTAGNVAQTAEGASNAAINTTLTNNSLFNANPNPTTSYYVETDPRFANYRSWLSSDYMLSALALDPALTQKRLGDGFYEQKLIREQVAQLTGRRFLTGYADDEAQYQAMMTNGVSFAQAHQLVPGVALSAAQVAQLTSDIVWLVEKTITLPNGSTAQALVPQVYVRLQPQDLDSSGALLAGNNIDLQLEGDLNNNSTIAGRQVVNLSADNINNIGGRMQAGNQLILDATHDINIIGTTQANQSQQNTGYGTASAKQTTVNRMAGLYVTNPNGLLVASAGHNINLKAAEIINSGSIPAAVSQQVGNNSKNGTTIIDAGNNLNLVTITETGSTYGEGRGGGKSGYRRENTTREIGTFIQTDGDLTLNADNNLTARAANVNTEFGTLNVMAGNDLTIKAGEATYDMEAYRKNKKSGAFSSKKTTTRDTVNDSQVIGSTFSGESVNMAAGNNLTIKASNVVGTNDVNLDAGNNITLTTEQATHDETHYKKTKQSGFSASSTSIGYGTSKLKTTNDSQQITNVGSTVGSVEGNVNINSGKTYTQTGSDVLTPQGDINITAQKVDIAAATDTYANQQSMKYKQNGITLAISNPVISAVQTAEQMKQAAGNTSDSRMQALATGTTALAAKNAYDAIKLPDQYGNVPTAGNTGPDDLVNVREANAADQIGGINLSISIGSSKSSSTSTQTSSTVQGSNVMAGGNINITASGAGKDSDINVTGSQIKAGNDATLKAEDQINLMAAQNTETLNSKNKSSSASVGVSIGTSSGLAVTASASKGKGKANGNDVIWTESLVEAGSKVALESGTDTNIIGTQVRGEQVVTDVGTSGEGNLNIQSLQDTSTYDSKQKSAGISVSVPIGAGSYGGSVSASNSKINSDYASVNEQAGIYAGDEGFQVNVNGNTNLKGAVIASTELAIQDGKNSLTTETLTVSNIQNKAEYEGEGSSATIGGGLQAGLPQLSGAGVGSNGDKASSTTVSAVSGGELDITDDAGQQAKSGKDASMTVALLHRDVHVDEHGNAVDSEGGSTANTIAPIFDAEKVANEIQAQVQITEAFVQQAGQAVETYVQAQRTALQEQLKNATTAAEKSAIKAQMDEVTTQERVMNVLISAVTGMGGAAVTKEGLSIAANQLRQLMIEDSHKFAGVTDGTTVLTNASGESAGVRGDGEKIGGTRIDLDKLCGTSNERCATNADGTLALDAQNRVVWIAEDQDGNPMPLATFLKTDEGKKAAGATGGVQGWIGTLFGKPYEVGSWQDKLIEAFSGTHDFVGGTLSGLYDEQGNATRGRSGLHPLY